MAWSGRTQWSHTWTPAGATLQGLQQPQSRTTCVSSPASSPCPESCHTGHIYATQLGAQPRGPGKGTRLLAGTRMLTVNSNMLPSLQHTKAMARCATAQKTEHHHQAVRTISCSAAGEPQPASTCCCKPPTSFLKLTRPCCTICS